MRALILSDIHSNLEALNAVIDDAAARGGFDVIWCLGDVVGLRPAIDTTSSVGMARVRLTLLCRSMVAPSRRSSSTSLRPLSDRLSSLSPARRAHSKMCSANDASMMMQPLPLGNTGVTGCGWGERPGHVCGPFAFPALRSQALAGRPTP